MADRKLTDCKDTSIYDAADLLCDSEIDFEKIERSIKDILVAIGEDPGREGLLKTPGRVSRAYDELLEGYRIDPLKLLNNAIF